MNLEYKKMFSLSFHVPSFHALLFSHEKRAEEEDENKFEYQMKEKREIRELKLI